MSYTLDPTKPYQPPSQSFAMGGSVLSKAANLNAIDETNPRTWGLTAEKHPVDQSEGHAETTEDAYNKKDAGPGETRELSPKQEGAVGGISDFDTGGAVPDGEGDQGSSIDSALTVVDKALQYGRTQHGLGGAQASAMPMIPGRQSEFPGPGPRPPQPQQVSESEPSTQSFDDGGLVEDDQSDQGIQSSNDTGTATTNDQQGAVPADQGPIANAGMAPHQLLQSGVKRLMSYLQGLDAAPPQAVDQLRQQVDPQGTMSEDERNLATVQAADQQGGPSAAWKVVQSNRQQFNAKQAFARAALNGVGGKPPDLNAAAAAATQAFPHMLDGSTVKFTPVGNGVTVSVSKPGSDTAFQTSKLTLPQFNDLLNSGKDGLYDNIMENGIGPVLQQLAQKPGTPVTTGNQQMAQAQSAWKPTGAPQDPNKAARDQDNEDIDPQLLRQANRLAKLPPQQAGFVRGQLESAKKAETELERTKASTTWHTEAAQIHADAYRDVAQVRAMGRTQEARIKLQGDLAKAVQSSQNATLRAQAAVAGRQIANVPLGQDLPPQTAQLIQRLMTQSQTPAATTPEMQPQQPGQPTGKRPPPGWVKVPQ